MPGAGCIYNTSFLFSLQYSQGIGGTAYIAQEVGAAPAAELMVRLNPGSSVKQDLIPDTMAVTRSLAG